MNALYEVVHRMRVEFEHENKVEEILRYAETWSDMPETDYDNLLNEIRNRRKVAFQNREKIDELDIADWSN